MPRVLSASICLLVLCGALAAQVVYIDNSSPTTGTSNGFPWGQINGFTTIHFYTAAQLIAGGVCPGSVLIDVAVAPSSGTAGTYNAPQARLSVGHVLVPTPVAGLWEGHILNASESPTVVHDLTSGPYTFPWTFGVWTSLPGFAANPFVWDGVRDIAIFYTSSAGVTGNFSARRTAANLRHAVPIFGATTEAPTSNGNFAMKVQLTFLGGAPLYQTNQPTASLDVDGIQAGPCAPNIANRGLGVVSMINVASANVGLGYEFVITAPESLVAFGNGGIALPGSGQIVNIDLFAPSLTFVNGLTFPPFPGNFSLPFSSPAPFALSAQLVVIEPSFPEGIALSSAFHLNVQ